MTVRGVALLCALVLGGCRDRSDLENWYGEAVQAGAASEPLPGVDVSTLVPGAADARSLRNPYGGNLRALEDGRRFFDAFNCSGCHAPYGGGGMGPPLSDTLWIYGGAPGNIYLSIEQGRPNGMPAWRLPPDVIWKLVSYIEALPDLKRSVSITRPNP